MNFSSHLDRVLVIIQARTTSTRLPAKVLLPIGGIPLAVLAAKRAANTGFSVTVATSIDDSDTYLTSVLESYGVPYDRGSLNNVLLRFLSVSRHCAPDTILVRMTADNPIPDGNLIASVVDDFLARELDYICCNGHQSGLPYGCSVEVMYVSNLRAAIGLVADDNDLEHVTPAVIRKFGMTHFTQWDKFDLGHLNLSIDNLSDYLSVVKLFDGVRDPISISSFDLLQQISEKCNS